MRFERAVGGELKKILLTLPTKIDLENPTNRLEVVFQKEMEEIKMKIVQINKRVDNLEHQNEEAQTKMKDLILEQNKMRDIINKQTLLIYNLENRKMRNNVKIKGIPEIKRKKS